MSFHADVLMDSALLCSRLALGVVFGLAGVTKLRDRDGTRQAVTEFGIPPKLAATVAWSLPVVEILVALALVPLSTARQGARAGALLLCAFELGIVWNLARGRAPKCHCFGQLHSRPLSWSLFARNLALLALAVLISLAGPGCWGPTSLLAYFTVGEVALGVWLVPVSLGVWRVLAQQKLMLQTMAELKQMVEQEYADIPQVQRPDQAAPQEGLPVGAAVPEFKLRSLGGEVVSLTALLAGGKWTILLFVSTNCPTCRDLLPLVPSWQAEYGQSLAFVLVSEGSLEENRKKLHALQAFQVLVHQDPKVLEAFSTKWTPSAILVSPEGTVASPVRLGSADIQSLVEASASMVVRKESFLPGIRVGKSAKQVGDPAPDFSLPDLGGKSTSLGQLRGAPSLLIFWAASCPHCLGLKPLLKDWHEHRPSDAPRLVLLAAGDRTVLQDELADMSCLILLDSDYKVSSLFGSSHSPAAVLVDAGGRLASTLASGRRRILALAEGQS